MALTDAINTKTYWHRDLLVFAVLCSLWSALLIFRVICDPFSSPIYPFHDVFLGIKFYGYAAHITMTIQAIAFAAFGLGILLHQLMGTDPRAIVLCGGCDQSHTFLHNQFQ